MFHILAEPSTSSLHGKKLRLVTRDVTRTLIGGGGGGCLFIYSCYGQRISFEVNSNSKQIRRAEHEYMNKHPPISVLVTSLLVTGENRM